VAHGLQQGPTGQETQSAIGVPEFLLQPQGILGEEGHLRTEHILGFGDVPQAQRALIFGPGGVEGHATFLPRRGFVPLPHHFIKKQSY
jgi:hypothetical protein